MAQRYDSVSTKHPLAQRWGLLLGAALAAMAVLLALAATSDRFIPNWDGAMYLMLADSVRHGDGYTYQGLSHAKFPPLYPLLLAVAAEAGEAFGLDAGWPERGLWPQKAISILAVAASAMLLVRLATRRRSPWAFLAGALPGLLAWKSVHHADQICAEWLFTAFQLGVLITLAEWGGSPAWREEGTFPRRPAILFVFLGSLASLARSAGLFLVAGGLAYLWWASHAPAARKLRSLALPFLLVLVVSAAWPLRASLLSKTGLPAEMFETRTYGRWVLTPNGDYTGRLSLLGVLERAGDLGGRYWRASVRLLSAETAWLGGAVTAVLASGLALAALRFLRERRDPIPPCLAATLMGYLLYTWGGDRFLLPILFLVGGLTTESLALSGEWLFRKIGRRWLRPGLAPGLIAVAVVLCLWPWHVRRFEKSRREWPSIEADGGAREDFRAAARWLREHAAPDDVVVSEEGASIAWLSGRETWSYPLVRDDKPIRAAIRELGADWLVHVEGREWVPRLPRDIIEGEAAGVRIVWQQGEVRILRLTRDALLR